MKVLNNVPRKRHNQKMVSGAIYDFGAYLTTLNQSHTFGSTHNASPMVDLIKQWAAQRKLSLDGADVQDWEKNI